MQTPQLTIQKFAPKEIQVGKPANFRVTVRNTGQIPACEVEVRDLVPKGTRLTGHRARRRRAARAARSSGNWERSGPAKNRASRCN